MKRTVAEKTIADFGRQHQTFDYDTGFSASIDLLTDVLGPLVDIDAFKDKDVVDLGSGPGRWSRIFHNIGAKTIAAVEPSPAIEVTRQATAGMENVSYHNVTGDKIPDGPYDFVYSYGVVHHIPEPDPVIQRAFEVLRPGGRVIIWLYGRENNGLYLFVMHALRLLTVPMPNSFLDRVSAWLVPPLRLYSRLCKWLPLPLKAYMADYIDKISDEEVTVVIYDQLDPHYAKYYTRRESIELLERAGFADVDAYHRAQYSWTVIGTKPGN